MKLLIEEHVPIEGYLDYKKCGVYCSSSESTMIGNGSHVVVEYVIRKYVNFKENILVRLSSG